MKNSAIFLLAITILVLLLLYSFTYTVRFDQVAVVFTYGAADDDAILNEGEQDESGLHWKQPYPMQSVKTYDKRVQVLEDRPEERQTRDNISVVIQPYLAWRINQPLDFYRSLSTMDAAEEMLRNKLREACRIVGRYTFSELANTDPSQLKLAEVESEILKQMRGELDAELNTMKRSYGIELQSVGIKRVLLAPKTTSEVFNRMKSTRLRMAEAFRQEGESRAKEIQAHAESIKATILSFASTRAKSIRAEGERAANKYAKIFSQDPEFAAALQKMDALLVIFKDSALGKSTFVFDTSNPLWQWFENPPGTGAGAAKISTTP